MKVLLTVEMNVSTTDLHSKHTPTKQEDINELQGDLLNQLVKVKSGVYDNALYGYITHVTVNQKIPRKR